jgi:L-fuconolactonase
MIGNLQPEKPEFPEYLERFHRNGMFLGIRYGNLWGYSLAQQVSNPSFLNGLKLMREAGLTLDTANPRPDLLETVLRVTDQVPGLRIVVDHLPALMWRLDAQAKTGLEVTLRELARRPSVYIKVSAMMRMVEGKASTDPSLYKPLLDEIFDLFGEDRLICGSDWPNADAVDNLPAIVQIVRDYFRDKPRAIAEKFFWRNSIAAYKWVRRDPSQPQAGSRG